MFYLANGTIHLNRLEASVRENQEFEARNAALQEKLKTVSAEKVSVSLQLGEIRITLQNVESQNSELQEMVNELQLEVDQVSHHVFLQYCSH